MMPDIIWRAANELLNQYGREAEIEAANRAGAYAAKGEVDTHAVWLPIRQSIVALQQAGPGETRH
jgi:hypothetical protein